MLNTVIPPEQWAVKKPPINVLARRKKVLGKVLRGGKRKIYKIGITKGFAGDSKTGATCLYFSGCSFSCQYCFVNPASLSGAKGKFYSPKEILDRLRKTVLRTQNPHLQLNGGEVFMTTEWTLELIKLLSEFFENECSFTSDQRPGIIWCDTMGFDLMREPQLFDALIPYKNHIALFISTKGHPDDFEIVSRTPSKFAEDSFLALERAWEHDLVAMPEVLDRMFWPQRMDWYAERLRAIHPNAPRVLHLDYYSPVNRVKWAPDKKMKTIGWRPNKGDKERNAPLREEVIEAWQKRLMALYGLKGMKPPYHGIDSPIFCCDKYPDESFRLVQELILNS
ncbi:MAG: 4Fe-4S cluster-binding domain-containing protein [Parcubacteria group bacterium]|nr:4Fe-4S cluster-binding domain-containing protein [Parcubacteria group bacterium]